MNPLASLGIALIVVVTLIFILSFLALAFWIWMLVDAATRPNFSTDGEKIAWILIIVFLNLLGAMIYFFAGYMRLEGTGEPERKHSSVKRRKK